MTYGVGAPLLPCPLLPPKDVEPDVTAALLLPGAPELPTEDDGPPADEETTELEAVDVPGADVPALDAVVLVPLPEEANEEEERCDVAPVEDAPLLVELPVDTAPDDAPLAAPEELEEELLSDGEVGQPRSVRTAASVTADGWMRMRQVHACMRRPSSVALWELWATNAAHPGSAAG